MRSGMIRSGSPGTVRHARSPAASARAGSPSGGHVYLSSGIAGVPPRLILAIVRDEQVEGGSPGGRQPWRKP